MFRSALVLIGLMSISASVEGWMNIINQAFGGIDDAIALIAPCPGGSDPPDHSYRCSGKLPLGLKHCCSFGEWLLNDGLYALIIGISVVVVIILSIFCCQCCSCCPGNRHRIRLAQPMIYQIPAATLVQQHSVGNLEARPAGCPGYSSQWTNP